jgi:hypothetical protein
MSHSLVAALAKYGFFEGVKRQTAVRMMEEIQERGWPAIFEESHRVFWVDPARLAEAGVGEFLERIRPFLHSQTLRPGEIVDDYGPERYSVEFAASAYRIYDRVEAAQSENPAAELARIAFARTVSLINDQLSRVRSAERLFALADDSGVRVIFLTPEMHELIVDHPEAVFDESPYLPSVE